MTTVTITTNLGSIKIELYPEKAPETCANFLNYCKEGFFTNTIFHRVIKGFMVQGGGLLANLSDKKNDKDSIKNEADNGLSNDKYTIAMARTQDPNSATSQFFINTKNNTFLNFHDKSLNGWGYCVFGKVIEGTKTVDAIEAVKTHTVSYYSDVPQDTITILKAEIE